MSDHCPKKLDGAALSKSILAYCAHEVEDFREAGIVPRLHVLTNPDDAAGKVYVKQKEKAAKEVGIELVQCDLNYLRKFKLGTVPTIVQLPAAKGVDIDYIKHCLVNQFTDVDGFLRPENIGAVAQGRIPANYPCTPLGIINLLECNDIELKGKSVLIIGRSNIVGRPLAQMMTTHDATVTLCHSETDRMYLLRAASRADIIVSAVGKRNIITYDELAERDAFVTHMTFVDVGMNRDENGNLCGDFDPEIFKYCYAYTPTPGGVGPMTVACLMRNVVNFYRRKLEGDPFR